MYHGIPRFYVVFFPHKLKRLFKKQQQKICGPVYIRMLNLTISGYILHSGTKNA